VAASGKRRTLIVGAGGHGKVVLDAVLSADQLEVIGFLDDDPEKWGNDVLGFPVLGSSENLEAIAREKDAHGCLIAIGDNYIRESLFRTFSGKGIEVFGLTHPASWVSRFAEVGTGVVILAGVVVNAGTRIEDNVCINTRASIDHDNHLSYSCHVFPNATLAGNVSVGEFSYVGSGAVIIPGKKVGRFAYCGAGAVIVEDVAEGSKVVGVPAKAIGSQTARPLPVK
jgi:sugar O-acyltransferase (sialic acid O-acetyltransferase NeuD family)